MRVLLFLEAPRTVGDPVPTILPFPLALYPKVCYNETQRLVAPSMNRQQC